MDEIFKGMTVNERLATINQLSEFHSCVANKDMAGAERILEMIDIGDDNVKAVMAKEFGTLYTDHDRDNI